MRAWVTSLSYLCNIFNVSTFELIQIKLFYLKKLKITQAQWKNFQISNNFYLIRIVFELNVSF